MPSSPPRAHPLPDLKPTHIVVHYNEIGLKGKNRGRFENRLVKNLKAALNTVGPAEIKRLFGRITVRLEDTSAWRESESALRKVFGVAHLMPAVACESGIESLKTAIDEILHGARGTCKFAIKCQRASKSLPYTSMDVQREVGAHVQKLTGWAVDLDDPELLIRIHLVDNDAFIALGKVAGPGGLPTGVSGRVVCLLSAGIDSPLAAYRLLQRGSLPIYAHFHSYPHTGVESQQKVKDLIGHIHPAGIRSRLYMLPFAEFQRRIVAACPAPLRVILYRRFMVRVATVIAARENALALVTGDSLGQVASQTLENLRTIDAACDLPILRPLIGMDKVEIVDRHEESGPTTPPSSPTTTAVPT